MREKRQKHRQVTSYRQEAPLLAIAERLPKWYEKNRRDLPWRDTGDPYDVWLSEIMLQQTRVAAVIDYFHRFKAALPDIRALAACEEDVLLKLWEGLGYYSRARNLKRAAELVAREYGGTLPQTAAELLALPGIGRYTAGAIASIAFGEPVPAVDGNVLRVCARIAGNTEDIALPQTKRALEEALAEVFCDACGGAGEHPGVLNQAMMELGATVCVPNGSPLCAACPMRGACYAERRGCADALPVRRAKRARRIEERTVLLLQSGERYLIRRRPARGLLAGLWELPSAEGHLSEDAAIRFAGELLGEIQQRPGSDWAPEPLHIRRLPDAKHIFTHIEWRMRAYAIRVAEVPDEMPGDGEAAMRFVRAEEIRAQYTLPSAFSAFTDELQ